ncbi:MAG TPA: DUF6263 family protein [Flavipsychrobacter sp.]|nr:DUF6263 family protein [Flavipsychrobacter sp.]
MSIARYYIAAVILMFSIALWGCDDNGLPEQNNGPISLQFNFTKDSSYQYILDSKMTLEPVVNGKTLTITQQMKLLSNYIVTTSSGDNKNVAVTYNRITMSSSNGITTNEYDSEDTVDQNPMFASVGAMMKRTFNISVSKSGITGVQNLFDEEQLNDSSASNYGDSSLRKAMLQFLTMYPAEAIKPGDTWKKEFHTSNGFIHMKLENTYTLKSIDGNIAHLELQGKITPEDTTQAMIFSGIQSGGLDVDIKTGLITIGLITQHLSGKISSGGKTSEVSATSEINLIGNKL